MRAITAGIILTTGCLFINLTGCQLGKPSLSSLAWWQNDSALASRYIEPPSHQFTPSESAVVSNDPALPPLPTDIQKTADSFEQEIARSYKELVKDSKQSNADLIAGLEKTQATEPLLPQTVPNPPEDLPQSTSPLSPLKDNSSAIAASDKTPNTGDFVPNASNGKPQNNALPELTPHKKEVSSNNDFQPYKTPNYMTLAEDTLPQTEPEKFAAPVSRPEEVIPPATRNNEAPPRFADNSNFAPAPTLTPKSTPNGTNADKYPSTPHKSFGAAAGAIPLNKQQIQPSQNEQFFDSLAKSPNAPAPGAPTSTPNTSSSLHLPTQGSYAPGSISTPSPIVPSQLKLPMPNSPTLH